MVDLTSPAPARAPSPSPAHCLIRIAGFAILVATMPLVEGYSMSNGDLRVYIGLGVPWSVMTAATESGWSLTEVTFLGDTATASAAVVLAVLAVAAVAEVYQLLHGPLRALIWAWIVAWVAVFGPALFWFLTLVAVPQVTVVICVIGLAVEVRRRRKRAWLKLT